MLVQEEDLTDAELEDSDNKPVTKEVFLNSLTKESSK